MNEQKRQKLLDEFERLSNDFAYNPAGQTGYIHRNSPEHQKKMLRYRELMDWFSKDRNMTSKQYRKYKQIMRPSWGR